MKKKKKLTQNPQKFSATRKTETSTNDPSGLDTISVAWSGPPGWDASSSQGYPQVLNSPVPRSIHLGGERDCESMECLAQEHDAMSLARARTLLEKVNRIPLIPSGWISSQGNSCLCSLPWLVLQQLLVCLPTLYICLRVCSCRSLAELLLNHMERSQPAESTGESS